MKGRDGKMYVVSPKKRWVKVVSSRKVKNPKGDFGTGVFSAGFWNKPEDAAPGPPLDEEVGDTDERDVISPDDEEAMMEFFTTAKTLSGEHLQIRKTPAVKNLFGELKKWCYENGVDICGYDDHGCSEDDVVYILSEMLVECNAKDDFFKSLIEYKNSTHFQQLHAFKLAYIAFKKRLDEEVYDCKF